MYYFSYGANLSEKELGKYTSYTFITNEILKDYAMVFRKILDHPRRSGVATIEPCKGKVVHGKIYHIKDTTLLDKKEGFYESPKIYNKHFIPIGKYKCMVYVLNPSKCGSLRKPRKTYKKMIQKNKSRKTIKGGSLMNILTNGSNLNVRETIANSQGLPIEISDYDPEFLTQDTGDVEISDYDPEFLSQHTGDVEIKNEINDEMYSQSLNIDSQMNEFVDNSIKNSTPFYNSSSLHNIVTNIQAIQYKICNIEKDYEKLLEEKMKEAKEKEEAGQLTRTETMQNWLVKFREIFIWQLYNESDIVYAYRLLNEFAKSSKETPTKEIIIANKVIDMYKYKIICAYFTKANIFQAILQISPPIINQKYQYLENTLQLLSCGVTNINYQLKKQWSSYLGGVPISNSTYVLSGGNIFFVFAGVLCYLYENLNTNKMLNIIKTDLEKKHLLAPIQTYTRQLFSDTEFGESMKEILSNQSDLDFLFFSDNDEIDESRVNVLSTAILRSLLSNNSMVGGVNESRKKPKHTKKKKKGKGRTILVKEPFHSPLKLFPFLGTYNDSWGSGRMYNLSNITPVHIKQININGKMSQYTGYRQTSSYIKDIGIFLNRIKQGYLIFDDINSSGECISEQKEYKTKYGECIDLSIGIINHDEKHPGTQKNILYEAKREHYKNKTYYTIENLSEELRYISAQSTDDKSEKREKRLMFLNKLSEKNLTLFNNVLQTIFKHIHNGV